MTARVRPCPRHVREGRLAKADQFWQAAEIIAAFADEADDVGDAYVTLCVHAGIAAADVICCARLGEHAFGENHNQARALLERADKGMGKHLKALLDVKTKSGYTHEFSSQTDQRRAGRAAEALMTAARSASSAAG